MGESLLIRPRNNAWLLLHVFLWSLVVGGGGGVAEGTKHPINSISQSLFMNLIHKGRRGDGEGKFMFA